MAQVRLTRRRWYFIPVLAVLALILAACGGSSGTTSTSPTGAVKSGGSLTFALDEDLAGFNILQANDSEFVLQEILDQTWPQVFIVQPSLKPQLNTDLVTSAKVVKTNPQTVAYKINPKATWSD